MSSDLKNILLVEEFNPEIPKILPHAKIYSIQVGHKTFKLSGASLSSDAPSYFTRFFSQEGNGDKVLFIDRSPIAFDKIYLHLQGYQISIDNEYEFVYLILDSYYFGLKRLQRIIKDEDIFATVGDRCFRISRSLLINSGNYPNFFSFFYDTMLTDNARIIELKNILRPPPQSPAIVSTRSPQLFQDLLEILRGNQLVIKNDEHRCSLIKECKYYRFLELEQRIIKHKIVNNPFDKYNKQGIIIGLNDLQLRGIHIDTSIDDNGECSVQYQRPYISKEHKRALIFQLSSDHPSFTSKNYSEVKLIIDKSFDLVMVQLTNSLCLKFQQLFGNISKGYLIENFDSETPSFCILAGASNCRTVINGMEMKKDWISGILKNSVSPCESENNSTEQVDKKRKLSKTVGERLEFILTKSLWKLKLKEKNPRLEAVLIEGVTVERSRTEQNVDFL